MAQRQQLIIHAVEKSSQYEFKCWMTRWQCFKFRWESLLKFQNTAMHCSENIRLEVNDFLDSIFLTTTIFSSAHPITIQYLRLLNMLHVALTKQVIFSSKTKKAWLFHAMNDSSHNLYYYWNVSGMIQPYSWDLFIPLPKKKTHIREFSRNSISSSSQRKH